jgi:hypothetical protein
MKPSTNRRDFITHSSAMISESIFVYEMPFADFTTAYTNEKNLIKKLFSIHSIK